MTRQFGGDRRKQKAQPNVEINDKYLKKRVQSLTETLQFYDYKNFIRKLTG